MIAKTVKTKETMSDKDRAIEHSIITFELMLKWKLTDRQKAAIQTNIDYLKSIN